MRPVADGGYGLDALWNDDFHHSAVVAATGRARPTTRDHRGTAMEFVAAAQARLPVPGAALRLAGQRRAAHRRSTCRRTASCTSSRTTTRSPTPLRGLRLHQQTSPARCRALTALLLLGPQLPMLFQGQEFGSSRAVPATSPITSAELVAGHPRRAAREFLAAVPEHRRGRHAGPARRTRRSRDVRARACSTGTSARPHAATLALHRDLLALRRTDPVVSGDARTRVDGALLTERVCLIRLFGRAASSLRAPGRGAPATTPIACWSSTWGRSGRRQVSPSR